MGAFINHICACFEPKSYYFSAKIDWPQFITRKNIEQCYEISCRGIEKKYFADNIKNKSLSEEIEKIQFYVYCAIGNFATVVECVEVQG